MKISGDASLGPEAFDALCAVPALSEYVENHSLMGSTTGQS